MKKIGLCAACALAGAILSLTAGVHSLLGWMELFARAGQGLRTLSLGSAAGNVAAWAIYAALCALPLLGLLPFRRRRGWADWLFGLASAYSLWLWLMLANPTRLIPGYYPGCEAIYGVMSGAVLLSLCLGGLIFRLAEAADSESLLRRTRWVLLVIAGLTAFAEGATGASFIAASQSGLETGYALWLCLCSAGQTVAAIWTLLGAADLLSAMRAGWFTEESVKYADELSRRAKRLLIATVACTLLANLAALILSGRVSNANVRFSLPIAEMVEAMGCMLLARFIGEGARVKAENDAFV